VLWFFGYDTSFKLGAIDAVVCCLESGAVRCKDVGYEDGQSDERFPHLDYCDGFVKQARCVVVTLNCGWDKKCLIRDRGDRLGIDWGTYIGHSII
jgi:hypothetical protein